MKTKLEIALEIGRQQKINSSISIAEQRHQQLELVEKIFNELKDKQADDLDEIVAKYVEPRNLKEISTSELLTELLKRNGEEIFLPNYFDLENLKDILQENESYQENDEKLFCEYLTDNDVACSECVEAVDYEAINFYARLKEQENELKRLNN